MAARGDNTMNRLEEILSALVEQHGIIQLSEEEYEEQQCKWANENAGNLNEVDGYSCDKCKNKGVIYILKENTLAGRREMVQRPCECNAIRGSLMRAKASGLNNVLSDYTFAKYIVSEEWQESVKEKARMFCKDDSAHWYYIGGQSGSGKTHICTAIAGHYIKHGKNVRYMLWRDDAVKLKQAVNDYEEYQKIMEEFKRADVLYIDDLFKVQQGAQPTAADINLAFEIINCRLMDKEKITIISSEYTITQALQIDEATIGRIYQKAGIYKIDIPKDSKKNYRLR